MPNIRIKDIPTTASATSSTDFIGIDGSANGTRKLSAYSPTFGGNLTVSGPAGLLMKGASIGATDAGEIGMNYNNSATGSLVFYGGSSAAKFSVSSAGNLTASGGTHTFGTANGGTYITTPGTAASTGTLFIQGGNASGSTAGGGVVLYGGSHASAPGWVRVGLAGTSKFAVNTSGLGSGTDVFTVDQAGNLTVSGTISSGSGTLTLNSSANTVVLQSAGTTALTLDSSQNATFAGKITVSGTADSIFGLGGTGNNTQTLLINGSSANTYGPAIHLRRNGTTTGFLASESATNTNNLNNLVLWGGLGNDVKIFTNNGTLAATYSGANTTFAGSIAINNTVQTAAAVVSTHKVTISIGGVTYYLLATNV